MTHRKLMPNPDYVAVKLPLVEPSAINPEEIPDRQWICPGLVPQSQTTMVSGDGGVGKSILAIQLAVAAATGRKWLGRRVERCRALVVACEDEQDEVLRRLHAICGFYGINFTDLDDLAFIDRFCQDNILMTWDGREAEGRPTVLWQQLHNATQDFGARLIVFDSKYDIFGGNLIDQLQARAFVHLLTGLARDCEGAAILLDHPSLTGRNTGTGESGSVAWSNAVRSRLWLTRPKEDDGVAADRDERVLRVMKSNYGPAGDDIRLRWSDGAFAVPQDETSGIVGSLRARNCETVFLDLLAKVTAEGRTVSDSTHAANYAPRAFAKRPDREGYARRDFDRAMQTLFAEGKIRMSEYGYPSDRRRKIVAVEQAD
jgi:RecA-family ATPase